MDAVRLAPKGWYTRAIGWGARRRLPRPVRKSVYSAFAACVGARLDEVELPLEEYPSLGSFFARRLRQGARPEGADDGTVVAPCDGAVAATGRVEGGVLVQAKGHEYRLGELLADDQLASELVGGHYVTVYLSPRDYHRVHSPVSGELLGYRYVPGTLLPVSPAFTESVPQLFVRNERVVFHLRTARGPVAVVMVGAAGVGNIGLTYPGADSELAETRWLRRRAEVVRRSHQPPVAIRAGDELGVFHLGSTVVLVTGPSLRLNQSAFHRDTLQVGDVIGAPVKAESH